MLHSPRRSPRLQSEAAGTEVLATGEDNQPDKPTVEKGVPPSLTPAKTVNAGMEKASEVDELKKQVAILKRQLVETKQYLAKSSTQCQSLQKALQNATAGQGQNSDNIAARPKESLLSSSNGLLNPAETREPPEPPLPINPMPPLPSKSHVSTNTTFSAPTTNFATTSTIFSTPQTNMASTILPSFSANNAATANTTANVVFAPNTIQTSTQTFTYPHILPSLTTSAQNVLPQNVICYTQPNLMLPASVAAARAVPLLTNTPLSAIGTSADNGNTQAQQNIGATSQYHGSVYSQLSSAEHNSSVPRKLQDLPQFSGLPEDWPIFYTAYVQSTAAYNYTNLENNQRLLKCLKGDARETVKCLLIHPDNVNEAVEQLRCRYGRPEQLIQSQLRGVRELPQISEQNMGKLVFFATKVKNLAVFLQSANGQQHIANPTLLEELVHKLPMSKKIEWARVAIKIQPYPTIMDFSNWINDVAVIINSIQDSEKDVKRRVLLNTSEKSRLQQQKPCVLCKEEHKLNDCPKFKNLQINERWNEIKKHHLCFSCLNGGHGTRNCRRKKPCNEDGCQRCHHPLLHEYAVAQNTTTATQSSQNVLRCSSSTNSNKLLFRILPVTLIGENCQLDIFALFDEGSSLTMLDRGVAEKLGVRGKDVNLNVQWFGGRSASEKAFTFNTFIRGHNKGKRHLLRNVYAVSDLNLPPQTLTEDDISRIKGIHGQIRPYTNVVPKLLIGLDHAHLGLPVATQNSNRSFPIASNTKLGWVVFGPCNNTVLKTPNSCLFVDVCKDDSLHQLVVDFFNVESIGVRSTPTIVSNDDARATKILENTTKRVGNHFQTGLLWKGDDVIMPNSYDMSLKRLQSMERKMIRDYNFSVAYKEIIASYIKKGYVRKLSNEEKLKSDPKKWYLPHFAVTNPNKPGKIRLVFDAAAQVDGVSLNSNLLKGPQDIELLSNILFNFRRGKIAVCADIREMFHQVFVQPEDRISQRFLWRNGDQNKTPDEYEMVVMTFGAACSPCCARFVLKKNAFENTHCDIRSIDAIIKHHYIDDYVDSFDSEDEAIQISTEVRNIHASGGFELRGFASNSENVSTAMGGYVENKEMLSDIVSEKVLGVFWECSSDNFRFKTKFHRIDDAVMLGKRIPTKRELLSIIMSTFDPIGFLACFIVGGKLILREVWRRDCKWDEQIPQDVANSWELWRKQLVAVADFIIPRCYFPLGMPSEITLHIFVDASEYAFAAVAYWRYKLNGETHLSFITSKTKCAPLKTVSIPRLELQAAVLGTRLLQIILSGHRFSPKSFTLWSDSKTVIKWIGSQHRRYKPYVAHRVSEILSSTDITHWKWVSTEENVADEATRFSANVDLSPESRWLCGPDFLKVEENNWPQYVIPDNLKEGDEEEIKTKFSLMVVKSALIEITRFSSLLKLSRCVAWVLRFVNKCRKKNDNSLEHGLTADELAKAEKYLIAQAQQECFSTEIVCLKESKSLPKDSSLKQLTPYVDDDGLLRVYGRIDGASYLPYSAKRPIILPQKHFYTTLVVRFFHCNMKHQNHEATICEIRKKYWVPHIRRVLRAVVSSCMLCRLLKAEPNAPLMGQLPKDRLVPCDRPFQNTGVDYFGPLAVTIGRRTEKRWVALFTCLSVRAIHLELAHDLSTDSFIIALKNFINRRGVPHIMRSDNGKNFVGANEEAKRFGEVFEVGRIQDELSAKGIQWLFNCPINPSEGGVWERMVQCVKKVLRITLKESSPKEHILHSLLIEAENIINSRPLTHLPVDVDSEEPLTPNHFLIGYGNVAQTPTIDEPDGKLFALRKQWRILKSLRDRFWKRWVLEYLPTLTRRVKWCERATPIKQNDVVFVCDPSLHRSRWCRGIVAKVYTGADGVARRADVKTASGLLQRPVSKLAILDLVDGEAERSTGEGM
ncbi:uncharacterized protein LOC142241581 [Haematobia irritans]|uniref:uncharacterized protein LOC142240173 n=1 Tax=Haematobia irritans TaxID=7368 RepID=UPI003F4FA5F0